jgi:hypothetical protein
MFSEIFEKNRFFLKFYFMKKFYRSAWRSVFATSKLKASLLTCGKAGALLLTRRSLETTPSKVLPQNVAVE